MKAIDAQTLEILRTAEYSGDLVTLTCGQLDRKAYQAVDKVLSTLGGKWHRHRKGHVFAGAAVDQLEAVLETGTYTDPKHVYGDFQTPPAHAAMLAARLQAAPHHTILEPSAGCGRLIDALLNTGILPEQIAAIEIQPHYSPALEARCCAVCMQTDFLRHPATPQYDRILMNPPFARQADIDHVLHAWACLKPGGRLVSVMSSGWTFRSNVKSLAFQHHVAQYGAYWMDPDGTFQDSGTLIRTCTVVLNKPEEE